MPEKVILTSEDIRRTLARISHEIIERNKVLEDLLLVGVHTRGVPLANRLAASIKQFEGAEVPVCGLDISPYRDDRPSSDIDSALLRTEIGTDVNDRSVIIVDDVLFTGRSVRAAMDAIIDLGRPRIIQLAVLIDRGHREIPIRADYVGKNVPSSRHEDIKVQLVETDGRDKVVIFRSNDMLNIEDELNKAGFLKEG